MKKKYRRTKTIHKMFIADNDNHKHFVSTEQVDKAHAYLVEKCASMSPVICLSNAVLAKHVLANVKMPALPAHYPKPVESTELKKSKLSIAIDWIKLKITRQ